MPHAEREYSTPTRRDNQKDLAGLNRRGDDACHLRTQSAMVGEARMTHLELAELARSFDDVAATRKAPVHEFREHRRQRFIGLEQLRQNHRILNREARAISAMRRRCMRRVPDQQHAAAMPGWRQQQHLERPIIDLRLVAQRLAHRSDAAAEGSES